ncbi:MAG: hypothetical protein A2X59_06470 [Nitrospirae bacterium GWC2_42_7]|nr:MAG: hypothetical protein A2X59_06470 [Nitrospirae bacterium GWC2_42_7]
MQAFKRLFLSRKTILVTIVLILLTVVAGFIIPQKFSTPQREFQKWQDAHSQWIPWIERLGFDHIYTTPWFALLLSVFLMTLSFSAYEQIKISRLKTYGKVMPSGEKGIPVSESRQEIVKKARKKGYIKLYEDLDVIRLVKYPWGYWGNVLFHIGMIITIASAIIIFLTERRGTVNIIERRTHFPESAWLAEEHGLLVDKLVLPDSLTLETISPEFWETDEIKQLTTALEFTDETGQINNYTLHINKTLHYKGIEIYQGNSFGNAFFIEFSDSEGRINNEILLIDNPKKRNKASYSNFNFFWMPYLLKVKYFADAEQKMMDSNNPLLVMRLMQREKIAAELQLKTGEHGRLGPYDVTLVHVARWGNVICVKNKGMPGIFLGFFIIISGVSLTYFMPPREIYIKSSDGSLFLSFRSGRFKSLYREEFEKIYKSKEGRRSA